MKYHKTPNFNSNCYACGLANSRREWQQAVPGQSEVPISRAVLGVISAYPGRQEMKHRISLCPRMDKEKPFPGQAIGAGHYIRAALKNYSRDFPDRYKPLDKWVYFTNAIKCPKPRDRAISSKERTTCHQKWLWNELNQLKPGVPILLAGSEAVLAVLGRGQTVSKNRCVIHQWGNHPVIVTMNPIEAADSLMWDFRLEEEKLKHDLAQILPHYEIEKKRAQERYGPRSRPKGNATRLLNMTLEARMLRPFPLSNAALFNQDIQKTCQLVSRFLNNG